MRRNCRAIISSTLRACGCGSSASKRAPRAGWTCSALRHRNRCPTHRSTRPTCPTHPTRLMRPTRPTYLRCRLCHPACRSPHPSPICRRRRLVSSILFTTYPLVHWIWHYFSGSKLCILFVFTIQGCAPYAHTRPHSHTPISCVSLCSHFKVLLCFWT